MEASNSIPDQQPLDPDSLPSLTEELLQSSEMREAIREELKRVFPELREGGFRHEIEMGWKYHALELTDPTTAPQLIYHFDDFCNKPTTLYYLAATKYDFYTEVPSACIYKQWFNCHNLKPNFEFGHFFCNPVRVSQTGPDSISRLLQIHASLCAQAISLHARLCSGEIAKIDAGNRAVWPDPKNYRPMPLCRAIIAVFDRFNEDFVNIKEHIHRQTLLLILTGDTSGLSAPVSFESIEAECLPLECSELKVDTDVNVVRVTIGTAVKFVTDLEKREQAAHPDTINESAIDTRLCPIPSHLAEQVGGPSQYRTADDYADGHLLLLEKKGLDADPIVQEAVLGVLTKKKGDVWPPRDCDPWLGRNAEGTHMDPWD